jgi:hypothetical protein
LVIFLHGQCAETLHYTKWSLLPAVLARSGYVVAIPELSPSAPWNLGDSTYTSVNDTLSWMHSSWPHKAFLMSSVLGIVGHSYGALYGGQLAATVPVTAYVSLGGGWSEWPSIPQRPLDNITIPKLLAWGTNEIFSALSQTHWDSLSDPKYRLRFTGAEHWDYIPSSACASQVGVGPCNVVPALASDITALFLSKFMPPNGAGLSIGENLMWPSHPLTTEQQFFIGGHMQSFQTMATRPPCHADLSWTTGGQSGTRSIP